MCSENLSYLRPVLSRVTGQRLMKSFYLTSPTEYLSPYNSPQNISYTISVNNAIHVNPANLKYGNSLRAMPGKSV